MNAARALLRVPVGVLLALFAGIALARPTPPPPTVDARAWTLVDFASGQTLASRNADQRMEPASLTKMMTVYVVASELAAGTIALDDEVPVSEHAWRTPGSRMFLEPGTRVTVEELLKGDIIQSGNDASVALAEYVAGSEEAFAELMNQQARRLGMTHSHFANSTGLPHAEHYTTAADIARLAVALIRDFPDIYRWFSEREYTYNGIRQPNRNRLLWSEEGVDGIKTGHTESAGYCLAASAVRDGRRLVSVVMGASNEQGRVNASRALLRWGFRFFDSRRLYAAGAPVTEIRVWKGARERAPVGLVADLYVAVPRGGGDGLATVARLNEPLLAPVDEGQQVGTLEVSLDGKPVASRPLVMLEAVPEGDLWTRLVDTVMLRFEGEPAQ